MSILKYQFIKALFETPVLTWLGWIREVEVEFIVKVKVRVREGVVVGVVVGSRSH